jgi:hypothetical protein
MSPSAVREVVVRDPLVRIAWAMVIGKRAHGATFEVPAAQAPPRA